MIYAVAFRDYIEEHLIDEYYYGSQSEPISFVQSPSDEKAVRAFLSNFYDHASTDWLAEDLNDKIMNNFIEYTIYGDDVLDQYTRQSDIENLISDIYDFYIETLMWEGKIQIMIDGGHYSFTIPSDVDVYAKIIHKKFPTDRLITLLTPEELKEMYIRVSMLDVLVIPLKELQC